MPVHWSGIATTWRPDPGLDHGRRDDSQRMGRHGHGDGGAQAREFVGRDDRSTARARSMIPR